MVTKVRTLDFLPEIFRTTPNKQFLGATLDQIVNQPNLTKIQGYIGRKFERGLNPNDKYVLEVDKTRSNYQLEPGVVFKNPDTSTAYDLITYPGIIDALRSENGPVDNHSALFSNEFYSWDSFIDLDKLINFNEYYWLPNGPDSVPISNASVNNQLEYDIQSNLFNYTFNANGIPLNKLNPILTLIRGGTYTFRVNQDSKFWIQTAAGTNGIDSNRQNVSSREIWGVEGNGVKDGTITFTVPFADDQKEFDLPGYNEVDLISDINPEEIHGKRLSELVAINGIDGVKFLDSRTVMFYGFEPGSKAELKSLYDEFGFEVDEEYASSKYTVFTDFFYKIEYLSVDSGDPIISLRESDVIPTGEKIHAIFGEKYLNKNFGRDDQGYITLLPQITAPLDTLYYQDEENSSKVGIFKLIEDKNSNAINVEELILGKETYTSPNNVKFTNGLKVNFIGNIVPAKYKTGGYYVEGVGTSIVLIPVKDLEVPESFTEAVYNVYDEAFDLNGYSATTNVSKVKDYITINRNSLNKNAWSRSNRWFHSDVLKTSIKYTLGKLSLEALNNGKDRAKRPIIEFYPNLKLFDSGVINRGMVDFVDLNATNALSTINGQHYYEPDGDSSALFTGSKIIFVNDNDVAVRNKIFVVDYTTINTSGEKVIVLSKDLNGDLEEGDQVFALRGDSRSGTSWYFDGSYWKQSQQKITVNQPPLFDILNASGVSLSDQNYYTGSNFTGSTIFEYAIGSGANDPILNFPIKYSSVSNLGDISFNISLNTDTFTYVESSENVTKNVKTGYPVLQTSRYDYTKKLGWVGAVEESFQYQAFTFTYYTNATAEFTCDVLPKDASTTKWPTIKVFVADELQPASNYTVTYKNKTTKITLNTAPKAETLIQVLINSSDALSVNAYYTIPANLSNNPFNEDVGAIDLGDIRGHYQSICVNYNNIEGAIIGPNNYRDAGDLLSYGDKIIQSSAPLTLLGTFLRKKNYSLIDSLSYSAIEYIKFKALLVDAVENNPYDQQQPTDEILDDVLQQISNFKDKNGPFFWSDMLPSGGPLISNTYTFNAFIDTTTYPLSRIYDYDNANYNGVLVYVSEIVKGAEKKIQLLRDIDYTVSGTQPKLTITKDIVAGQKVIVNEYNQTYGSFVPNTPSKLGLYPVSIPELILDKSYLTPTYFIKGHDGSLTKVRGEIRNGEPVELVDRVFLEFETRIYNNIKTSNKIPLIDDDVIPGFFRKTDYSYTQVQKIYLGNYLNWVGQNRVEYKKQYFDSTNKWTWNYSLCTNRLDSSQILQGNWRGIYIWLYDTSTPHQTPWEMLGFVVKPAWWDSRYGEAPYTKENTLLWDDLENGINYNNGLPVVIESKIRTGLSKIIPVDSAGNLLPPIDVMIGDFDQLSFNRDWKAGDVAPAEYSYLKSSTWPFDLLKILALCKPAKFFALAQNIDSYEYNYEFDQFLVNSRLRIGANAGLNYGNGTAHHGYTNWIIDFVCRNGYTGFNKVDELLSNLDIRLIYRVAGFTDKDMLTFYLEKSSPNTKNKSLILPDNSYSVVLYDNQALDTITHSGLIIQKTEKGYRVYGNSQNKAYFKTYSSIINRNVDVLFYENISVDIHNDFKKEEVIVPYGTEFISVQTLAEFIKNYGRYLEGCGFVFENLENGMQVDWNQMIVEVLYWIQSGWEIGSTINVNPAANGLKFNKENVIIQPLTIADQNFVLNQNLNPITVRELEIRRDGTEFEIIPLNTSDTISFFTASVGSIEHAIVFDNKTLFNDTIYNVTTGLRQYRLLMKGTKTAEWSGTLDAQGFILNQDNIQEWKPNTKYTKGSIVKYKNVYWTASNIIQPADAFNTGDWLKSDYDKIQKGLLPNASTRAYESTLYYDTTQTNLKSDADLLAFSLIGYRPREYLAASNLNDISQVNIFKNIIAEKGTRYIAESMQNIELSTGQIKYDVYENWAIKTGEHGGVLNQNFVEFKLDQNKLISNPSIVAIVKDVNETGAMQQVPLYTLTNYNEPIASTNILATLDADNLYKLPSAGYVNFDDIKSYGITFAQVDSDIFPSRKMYQGDYIWIANHLGTWGIYTPVRFSTNNQPIHVIACSNNFDDTVTFVFDDKHNLQEDDMFMIINFDSRINGYYSVAEVTDLNSVTVNFRLDPSLRGISGKGIPAKFQSQRVTTTKDIETMALVNDGFTKSKVWVDNLNNTASDDWGVYQKSLNYNFNKLRTPAGSSTFGTAVVSVENFGYLVTDVGVGKLYLKSVNDSLIQTIVGGSNYGTAMVKSGSKLFVSQPNTNSTLYVYELIKGKYGQRTVSEIQRITITAKRFGESLAVSGDGNWLFVSGLETYEIQVYRLVNNSYELVNTIGAPNLDRLESAPENPEVGSQYYNIIDKVKYICTKPNTYDSGLNAWVDPTWTEVQDKFGQSIATTYDGTKIFVGAPWENYNNDLVNVGYTYIFDRVSQTFIQKDFLIQGIQTKLVTLWQVEDITDKNKTTVLINNKKLDPSEYEFADITVGNNAVTEVTILSHVSAGDVVEISSSQFAHTQKLHSYGEPNSIRPGVLFGHSLDCNTIGTELLIGAPFDLTSENVEGTVYRYTNQTKKFGIIKSSAYPQLSNPTPILINGFGVTLPNTGLNDIVKAINTAGIPNVKAVKNSNNTLTIQLIDSSLGQANNKLTITVFDVSTLADLHMEEYVRTQQLHDINNQNSTQFGFSIKFNEHGSFAVGAPVADRFIATTFDTTDDENNDNDSLFDNGFTKFVDKFESAGTAYIYDYLSTTNESINDIGKFVFGQAVNDLTLILGANPNYGKVLAFNEYRLMVGCPNYGSGTVNGRVVVYTNNLKRNNWNIYRKSEKIVDVNKIHSTNLYNNTTNERLESLDYIDPLQGKMLGVVNQNIDFISAHDPAGYTNTDNSNMNFVWGENQLGSLWFDVTNARFVNYHQNDSVYNAKHWGQAFPGSTVAVYSWIESDKAPMDYIGSGTPYDIGSYTNHFKIDNTGALVSKYYYWVRNTNTIFTEYGKTLSDKILEEYITDPQQSGISYLAALKPNVFGIYNSREYINDTSTSLTIRFSKTDAAEPSQNSFALLRDGHVDDFLSGFPTVYTEYNEPKDLYEKMLDSLSGLDIQGQVVPDPYLPRMLQTGINVRPRQSFFINRLTALKNYCNYANTVLKQYPIAEFKIPSFLNIASSATTISPGRAPALFLASGADFDTTQYWEYVYWWADGYTNKTKIDIEVNRYYDLARITAKTGMVVGVTENSDGKREVYTYDGSSWIRVGLEQGTIQLKNTLWDYNAGASGFGNQFFDSNTYDKFPSAETRYILRALNEEIYTGALRIHRNKSLILLFEYIVSETNDNLGYLPWLNKTSFVDIGHTLRTLEQDKTYQLDNQTFLEGFINEVKPYHVVIKDFAIKYDTAETYSGKITDFDLPAIYNSAENNFVIPNLVFKNPQVDAARYLPTNKIWSNPLFSDWFANYGLSLSGQKDFVISRLTKYIATIGNKLYVESAFGFPNNGVIKIDDELIGYQNVDRDKHVLYGITRGVNGTPVVEHFPESKIYMDLPGAIVLDTGRAYIDPPVITAYIDTDIYPAPTRIAHLEPIMDNDKVIGVQVLDPGAGYSTQPEIIVQPSKTIVFNAIDINQLDNTLKLNNTILITGDSVRYVKGMNGYIKGLEDKKYYYIRIIKSDDPLEVLEPTSQIAFYESKANAIRDNHRIDLTTVGSSTSNTLQITARIIAFANNSPVRELTTTIKFDRTSYRSVISDWNSGDFYFSTFTPSGFESSLGENLSKATKLKTGISGSNASEYYGEPAEFSVYSYVYDNTYGIALDFSGTAYAVNDKITIFGNLLGGTTPNNDLVINVDTTDEAGRITKASVVSGTAYVSPANEFKNRASMQGARIDIAAVNNTEENTKVTVNLADTNVSIAQLKGLRVYFYKNPISYIWEDITSSGSFVVGIEYTIQTVDDTDYIALGAIDNEIGTTFTATGTGLIEAGDFEIGKTYVITRIGKTNFTLIGAANNTVGTAFVATGAGNGDGVAKQGTGTVKRTGSATIEFYKPNFGSDRVTNEYFVNIIEVGNIYNKDDEIRVKGSLLGGTDGKNDAVLKIVYAPKANIYDTGGGISIYELTGVSPKMFDTYYLQPVNDTEVNVYHDAPMVRPVKSAGMVYTATDWIYLPEPVIITTGYTRSPASLVRFNNKVYRCLTSNSDTTFNFDNWEDVLSHDDELNALDRIIGYYQPTANMPGRNLPMLVSGIEYSNNTYYGTKFNETTPIDTEVVAQPFYPSDINIKGITHSGTEYIAVADTKTHTILMSSDDGITWGYRNISNKHLGVTDIYYSQTYYVATTTNKKSPLIISYDGLAWITAGVFIPFDSTRGFDGDDFDDTELNVPDSSLRSVVFHNNTYTAVGDRIVSSGDGYNWQEIYSFSSKLDNTLNSVEYVTIDSFQGYIAVGGGYAVTTIGESEPGIEIPIEEHFVSRIFTSATGFDWQEQKIYLCQNAFNIVFASNDTIVVAGDNGKIFYTTNGTNWVAANTVDETYTNNLLGGIFANSTYVLVGENGLILVSYDGSSWSHAESTTTQRLNSVTFNEDHFIVTGDNATILRSYDGVIWQDVSFVKTPNAFFEIQGDKFTAGYGPEELVAGDVADNLSITVTTKPGATWPHYLIPFTGFNISVIESLFANNPISFDSAAENPVQVQVFVFDRTTNTGRKIYPNITTTDTNPYTYEIDWINKTITFNTNVDITEKVYIEVYEIGGGNHIVRSTSQHRPIRSNEITGNSEILLGYKYEAVVYTTPIVYLNGSPLTYAVDYNIVTHSDKQAKILFNSVYDSKVDFLSFAVLGDTIANYVEYSITEQYGYSLPISETFAYNDSTTFTISSPINYSNEENVIVEHNGYRLTKDSDYVLTVNPTSLIGTLEILVAITTGDFVSVTTFNDTRQQSLSTEVKNIRVNGIESIDFTLTVPIIVIRHEPNFVNGDIVRIDGITGTNQLNNNTYYASVTSSFTRPEIQTLVYADTNVFDLFYSQIQDFSTAEVQKNAAAIPTAEWILTPDPTNSLRATLTIDATLVSGDIITVTTTDGITYYSVVLFNDSLLANPIRSKGVLSAYVSGGYIWKEADTIELAQPADYDVTNTQRIYVSVNKKRVHPNLLRFNSGNKLSIMKELATTDSVLITSMIPNASPNEMVFNINVDKNGNPTVFRSNGANKTWLTKPLQFLDNTVYVEDVSKLIDIAVQDSTVIEIQTDVLGVWLDYDSTAIKQVTVYNVTSLTQLSNSDYVILSKNSRIYVKFKEGVELGDTVTVSIRLGDTIYVGSEKIRFKSVNYQNNTILGITRGIGGTGTKRVHGVYETVSSLTPRNVLPVYYYDKSWNSENFRDNGDLLQISDYYPARFLRVGTK